MTAPADRIAELENRLTELEARPDPVDLLRTVGARLTALENALPEDQLAHNTQFLNGAGHVENEAEGKEGAPGPAGPAGPEGKEGKEGKAAAGGLTAPKNFAGPTAVAGGEVVKPTKTQIFWYEVEVTGESGAAFLLKVNGHIVAQAKCPKGVGAARMTLMAIVPAGGEIKFESEGAIAEASRWTADLE